MKPVVKSLMWGMAVATLAATTPAIAEVKIAYVDYGRLQEESPQAKAALEAIRSVANEVAQHRVRVNTIHPASVPTGMTTPELFPLVMESAHVLAPIFMNALPVSSTPAEHIAAAVAWLCSDEAAEFTGIALPLEQLCPDHVFYWQSCRRALVARNIGAKRCTRGRHCSRCKHHVPKVRQHTISPFRK